MSIDLADALEKMGFTGLLDWNPDGKAQTCRWRTCEDGWIVEYGTGKAVGGPHDGKYVVMVYRPYGPGSRTGHATQWKRVVFSGYAKRKTARAHALAHFYKHNPKLAKRRGK